MPKFFDLFRDPDKLREREEREAERRAAELAAREEADARRRAEETARRIRDEEYSFP